MSDPSSNPITETPPPLEAPPSGNDLAAAPAPARQTSRKRITPLGFDAGSPCPRMCGGVLTEAEGCLRCSVCDFRYPEKERPTAEVSPPPPPSAGPIAASSATASPEGDPNEELRGLIARQEALLEEITRQGMLLDEIERLKEENRRLLAMVRQLTQERPSAKNFLAGLEGSEIPAEVLSQEAREGLSDAPAPGDRIAEKKPPWWKALRPGKNRDSH
jgi:hypothetical protein